MVRQWSAYSGIGAATGLLLLAGALVAGGWWFLRSGIDWPLEHGLRMLAVADAPAKQRLALQRWEREVRAQWGTRAATLTRHMIDQGDLSQPHVRALLTQWTNADFGSRRDDWLRWLEQDERLARGKPLESPPRSAAVKLEKRWSAPVGLTGWFTTVLPIDGQIYVASLGASFGERDDLSDGIVRVDGRSGSAEVLFTPPDRGPRDIIGLAAIEGGLAASCQNGYVYALDFNGKLRWKEHVGAPLISPPLTLDINRDGVSDVLAVTRAGKVVAINGARGRTAWVAALAARGDGLALGATLALGDFLPGGEPEVLVCTVEGELQLLTPSSGASRWKRVFEGGSHAGGVARGPRGPSGHVVDRNAGLWSLVPSNQRLEALLAHSGARRDADTTIAAPRLLDLGPEAPPGVIYCPTGGYEDPGGAVVLVGAEGVQWRVPLRAAIWATPALANLNETREPEIIVATIEPPLAVAAASATSSLAGDAGADHAGGGLLILDTRGHVLRRETFSAAIECAPVVADIDGDSRLEILVIDQAGYLHAIQTHSVGPVVWGLIGGDTHNSRNPAHAYSFGQAPFGYQAAWRPQ